MTGIHLILSVTALVLFINFLTSTHSTYLTALLLKGPSLIPSTHGPQPSNSSYPESFQWPNLNTIALINPTYQAEPRGYSSNPTNPSSYLSALQKPSSNLPIQKSQSVRQMSYPKMNRYQSYERGSRESKPKHGNGCRHNNYSDSLKLSIQWEPGTCATSDKSCIHEEARFSIHGMWPYNSRDGESQFECCRKDKDFNFNYTQIISIEPDLNKYWYSYYSDNGRSFWKHEWVKHGTCAENFTNLDKEVTYFKTTIELAKRLPLLDILTEAKIRPDNNETYESEAIKDALKKITGGKDVGISCDLQVHQSIAILKSIEFCYNKALDFTDCRPSAPRCKNSMKLLESSRR